MSAASRVETLERRVKADPASVAFAALAEEYRRAGRLGEAVEVSRSGLERHPGYASARVTLGRALHELAQLEDARAEFETVLESAPENLAAIRGLADIHRQRGDRAGTLEYLQRALTLAPLDAELRDAIAEAEQRMAAEPTSARLPEDAAPAAPPEAPPLEEADSDFGELPGFEPPFDLPIIAAEPDGAWADLEVQRTAGEQSPLSDVGRADRQASRAAVEEPPLTDVGRTDLEIGQPAPPEPPFALAEPSGPESPEHAGPPDAHDRSETLRRQEAALEHFLAQILKERERRAS